ncbi:TonB-dependent receptor [Sphingomonas fennica]|nr:TonB-dependent receptor [Sphingomonas fennica]
MTNRFWLGGVSALAMTLCASAAMAQDAAGTAPQSADASSDSLIGDIVVTAQRRSERLQDVPLSVTAVSGADLTRSRVNDASRLQLLSPGLTWGQQGADSFPAIRGVRTQLVSAQSDPVIGFYLDGVYQSRTQQQSIPLFDIARVEVQRGPQGTLYGRNTFGGNISVVTQLPTKDFEAGFNAAAGNYNLRQFDAFVNLPVSDTLQLRVAGYHSEHDGYVRSTTNPDVRFNDEDQSALRASLLYTPTERLEVQVHAGYWERNDAGGGAYGYKTVGTLIDPATGMRSINGVPYAVNPSVTNGSVFVNGVDIGVPVTGDEYHVQWDYQPTEYLREKYVNGQIGYDFGGVAIKSITGYTKFRSRRSGDLDQSSMVFPAAGVTAAFAGSGIQQPDTDVKTFSQELQLSSTDKGSPLQWIVGGYYFHDMVDELYSQVYTAPTATALSTRSRTEIDTKAYALYGQATYSIIPDTLRLTAGIRYSDETKDYVITNFTAPAGTFNFDTQTAARGAGQAKFNKVTWRAGVEFNATRDNMLYASVSTGFESGGINNNSNNALIPPSYAPQTVTAYEIGSKNKFADGRIILNASLFYNKYKDLQITILDPLTNLSYYSSAGAARSYGAEFELKTLPVDGLHVDLTAALLNAKFTKYVRPNPFGDTATVDLAGNRVPTSPTLKTTASISYDADLGDHGMISPRIDLLYSTKYYSTDYNTVLDLQKSYATVDASLRYTPESGSFYVEGFVNNLTDKAVIYSATLGGNARIQESFSPPRVWGVRLGASFR